MSAFVSVKLNFQFQLACLLNLPGSVLYLYFVGELAH